MKRTASGLRACNERGCTHPTATRNSLKCIDHREPDACLIVFPATTALDTRCPRCGCKAGEHPAPMDLLDDPETPVMDRPTLREATR